MVIRSSDPPPELVNPIIRPGDPPAELVNAIIRPGDPVPEMRLASKAASPNQAAIANHNELLLKELEAWQNMPPIPDPVEDMYARQVLENIGPLLASPDHMRLSALISPQMQHAGLDQAYGYGANVSKAQQRFYDNQLAAHRARGARISQGLDIQTRLKEMEPKKKKVTIKNKRVMGPDGRQGVQQWYADAETGRLISPVDENAPIQWDKEPPKTWLQRERRVPAVPPEYSEGYTPEDRQYDLDHPEIEGPPGPPGGLPPSQISEGAPGYTVGEMTAFDPDTGEFSFVDPETGEVKWTETERTVDESSRPKPLSPTQQASLAEAAGNAIAGRIDEYPIGNDGTPDTAGDPVRKSNWVHIKRSDLAQIQQKMTERLRQHQAAGNIVDHGEVLDNTLLELGYVMDELTGVWYHPTKDPEAYAASVAGSITGEEKKIRDNAIRNAGGDPERDISYIQGAQVFPESPDSPSEGTYPPWAESPYPDDPIRVKPVFPGGDYKMRQNPDGSQSNVLLSSHTFTQDDGSEKTFVVPNMAGGEEIDPWEEGGLVKRYGLENFPSFPTVPEAEAWIEENHGNIDTDGYLRRADTNVGMMAVTTDDGSGRWHVIPTMRWGEFMEEDDADELAKANGFDTYPTFKTKEDAMAWMVKNQGKIDEFGRATEDIIYTPIARRGEGKGLKQGWLSSNRRTRNR